jgi:CheY-like chemotaxis protein
MQLALQDFGVEVKSVPVGLDVLAVAKTFKPDIVFADVLLAKRNGYDVCLDLKSDPETQHIPVVLMWSGFMEVDEARIAQSRPDARLEKPFDSETLRQLVQHSVAKTQSNPVSSYLQFPKMPEFTAEAPEVTPHTAQASPRAPAREPAHQSTREPAREPAPAQRPTMTRGPASSPSPTPRAQGSAPGNRIPTAAPTHFEPPPDHFGAGDSHDDAFSIDTNSSYSGIPSGPHPGRPHGPAADLPMIDNPDMDPESEMLVAMDEDFAAVPLQPAQQRDQLEDDGWTQQDLKKFKIQTPEAASEDDFATRFVIPQDELANAHIEVEGEFEEIHFGDELPETGPLRRPPPTKQEPTITQPNARPRSAPSAAPPPPLTAAEAANPRDPALIERVIREECREVIENICWKVIPEMVERIVREEINKILRDTEKSL